MKCLMEADLKGQRVLIRVDFNVPQDKNGSIIDDSRIKGALPTIEYVLDQGGYPIVMSHLGRPDGQVVEKLSLKKMGLRLDQLLDERVVMLNSCIGEEVRLAIKQMGKDEVIMLENLRFHPGEEKNDPGFCRQLAELGDIYVNDAFGTAHRDHASTVGITAYLPCYAGFLLQREVTMLKRVLEHPAHPKVAILGGGKVFDKLDLIENLLNKVDIILIGGGMANTFLKAQGYNIGRSLYEEGLVERARYLIALARAKNTDILLPVDVVVADKIDENARSKTVDLECVGEDWMIVDIGPRSTENYARVIAQAQTVVWNGPLGVYEYKEFARGTESIVLALAQSPAVSIIGGGDSAAVVYNMGLEEKITHISTGGGATLEFLEGKKLPGLVACGG